MDQVKINGCLRLGEEAGDTGQQGHKEIPNGTNWLCSFDGGDGFTCYINVKGDQITHLKHVVCHMLTVSQTHI